MKHQIFAITDSYKTTTGDIGLEDRREIPAINLQILSIEYSLSQTHFGDDRDHCAPLTLTTLSFEFTSLKEGLEECVIKDIVDGCHPSVLIKSIEFQNTSRIRYTSGEVRKINTATQKLIVCFSDDYRLADEWARNLTKG